MLTTSEIVKKYNLITKKSLGQNFLLDSNITDKIAKSASNLENCEVLEIGPGPGGLTRSILNAGAKKVVVVEMDDRAIDILQAELKPEYKDRLQILHGDALETDATELVERGGKIIANLPYNISTILLAKWLNNAEYFSEMILMFQKEVGDRLTAKPKSKDYGRISVMAQFLCDVKKEFDIKPSAFVPPPKVMSSVIKLTPRTQENLPLQGVNIQKLSKVCEVLFNQRRKIIKSKLLNLRISLDDIIKLGIDPNQRAEELSVTDYARLSLLI